MITGMRMLNCFYFYFFIFIKEEGEEEEEANFIVTHPVPYGIRLPPTQINRGFSLNFWLGD